MARILLVAATTGYQTRSFTAAAHRLGMDVTLATDRCHILEDPWQDHALPLKFEEPEKSAELVGNIEVDGIVAVADRPTTIAALIAQRLKLPFHSPAAVAACRDKHRMREIFCAAGLPVPGNFSVPLSHDPRDSVSAVKYPCVLKPLGLSASRGVIRANNPAQFLAAFQRIRSILEEPEIQRMRDDLNKSIQIEDYIEGREFALEGLVTHGKLSVLAIFDKPDPLEGPFFEETIYVTPSREPQPVQQAIVAATAKAVRALGLHHGPIHAEMRVNAAGVYLLEIAARPIGGLCARALRFSAGSAPGERRTLEELVLMHAVGDMPPSLVPDPPASGVMMIPVPRAGIYQQVTGVEDARSIAGVDDIVITAKPGQKMLPAPDSASYPGFIFASGPDPAFVESAIRLAFSRLTLHVTSSLEIV